MSKRLFVSVFAILVFFCGSTFAMKDARLLRMPDINGNLIAFVYAGDIWTVPATGGNATRLTSHQGLEFFPKISPDGKWIAFSGEYSGSRQVYAMPVAGGTPSQLTFYNDVGVMPPRGGFDHITMDWTPDSKQILIRANRTPHGQRMGKYFLVDLKGGLEVPLQIPEAGIGSFSPDGQKIVYTPISREFRTWKRTKGGRAADVWTYDLKNNTSKRITTFTGTDQQPFWYGEKLYFVSDRELTLNIYSFDMNSEQINKITDYSEYDVLWPSGQGGQVVFENGGYIHKLDLGSGTSKKVTVDIHFDNPNVLASFRNVSRYVSRFGYGISTDGGRVVFDARGDLFTVPAKEGVTVNLTRTQGIREFFPVWSPDGKWIAYYSDETGDYELYLIDPKRKKKRVQLTKNHRIWKFPVDWSPDNKNLLFLDKNNVLQYMDVGSKKITKVDKAAIGGIDEYVWSNDSKWIAYTKSSTNWLTAIWVYSLDSKKATQLTGDRYNDFSPVFSADGKYMYFASLRDFNMNFSSYEFDFIYNRAARIYAVALTSDVPALFKDSNDLEEKSETKKGAAAKKKDAKTKGDAKAKEGDKEKEKTIRIDFNRINQRIVSFPLPPGNYNLYKDVGGKLLYISQGALFRYDLKQKKAERIIAGIGGGSLSGDGKKMLYQAGRRWGIIPIAPNQKVGNGILNLADVAMKIDPRKEWKQIYNEGWRIYRDWFYVENMHGVDWEKMRAKYAKLLPFLSHRADLDFIFGELVGELNVGHTYVNWGDFERVSRLDIGLLGAQLEADAKAGRYTIAKIYEGENWNRSTFSPLTEQGVGVKDGDYLLKINGKDVTTRDNPYRFLENLAGKRVEITVSSEPNEAKARTYWIRPVRSEQSLFHLDWLESRRKLVDKLSNGRIGYIFVPNTAVEGNRELFKGIYANTGKEALIIDERYNGGGWSPGKMIELMSRKRVSYWHQRGLKLRPEPVFAIEGPKAMLINHYSSSGGDNFPYWFKAAKLGKLIGTRTWGGLVGYGWSPSLVDGPSFAVPSSGIVNTKGEWVVEGVGVYPDIEVYDRPEEVAAGRDPSIEAAVKYLLEELKKYPPRKDPNNPALPDRSKWIKKKIKK